MLDESKKLDKHDDWTVVNFTSTDVMGDIRALVAVPLLATLGLKVPNVQGMLDFVFYVELIFLNKKILFFFICQ